MEHTDAETRAVGFPRDIRPFLARVIDHAIAHGQWTDAELEELRIDLTNMVFRYLRHQRSDIRDLHAVGVAAEIVIMYVSDGLAMLAGDDLEVGARLLADDAAQPLLRSFRVSYDRVERLRSTIASLRDRLTVVIGPPKCRLRVPLFPHADVAALVGSDRIALLQGVEDVALRKVFLAEGTSRSCMDALLQEVARIAEDVRTFLLLPMNELERPEHWRALLGSDAYALVLQGNRSACYEVAWTSVVAHVLARGRLGLLVRMEDIERVIDGECNCTAPPDDSPHGNSPYELRPGVRDRALAVIAAALPDGSAPDRYAAIQRGVDEGIRNFLTESGRLYDFQLPRRSGAWFVAWRDALFLVGTDADRAAADGAIFGPMGQRELLDQYHVSVSPTERRNILHHLALDRLSPPDVLRLLDGRSVATEVIIERSKIADRSVEDIERLAKGSYELGGREGRALARAIIADARALPECSADAIFSLALQCFLHTSEQVGVPEVTHLLERWNRPTAVLTRAFAEDAHLLPRKDWVRIAAFVPRYFEAVLYEAEHHPDRRAAVNAFLADLRSTEEMVIVIPAHLVRCFQELEAQYRAQPSEGPLPPLWSGVGTAQWAHPMLEWVWSGLPGLYRDAIAKAFRDRARDVDSETHAMLQDLGARLLDVASKRKRTAPRKKSSTRRASTRKKPRPR